MSCPFKSSLPRCPLKADFHEEKLSFETFLVKMNVESTLELIIKSSLKVFSEFFRGR